MYTADILAGLACLECGATQETAAAGEDCPECGGPLAPAYEEDGLARAHEQLARSDARNRDRGLARFASVLPVPSDALVTLAEGGTPLVDCPTLAEELGVGRLAVKDEARNPTGSVTDREMALGVSAAADAGATEVVLPTTGNAGHAAAAYASRAGLDSLAFVPSRAAFENKAMINVHGGDMNVVGGRYPDARAAFEESFVPSQDRYSLAPFATPDRHEGTKTLAYELALDHDAVPDAVVCPTGHGTVLFGLYRGFRELERSGTIQDVPRLFAAQAGGCAPLATAWAEGRAEPVPVEHPDTVCGALEVPDPRGGRHVLQALSDTDGAAIGTGDQPILERAVDLAAAGVQTSATGGVAVSGAVALAEQGAFSSSETIIIVNPTRADREADLLRSHLMSTGV